MTQEGPLEDWIKKLNEENLKENTFDRRRFIQGAGKIAAFARACDRTIDGSNGSQCGTEIF